MRFDVWCPAHGTGFPFEYLKSAHWGYWVAFKYASLKHRGSFRPLSGPRFQIQSKSSYCWPFDFDAAVMIIKKQHNMTLLKSQDARKSIRERVENLASIKQSLSKSSFMGVWTPTRQQQLRCSCLTCNRSGDDCKNWQYSMNVKPKIFLTKSIQHGEICRKCQIFESTKPNKNAQKKNDLRDRTETGKCMALVYWKSKCSIFLGVRNNI